jgi:hypothetical protein
MHRAIREGKGVFLEVDSREIEEGSLNNINSRGGQINSSY